MNRLLKAMIKKNANEMERLFQQGASLKRTDKETLQRVLYHVLDDYDVIYLGYPNYWDRAPAMINTFLGNIDLTGKTVIPFCTSSSDGIEGSMTDIRNSAQGANILEGLRISGGSAESNRSEIQTWLNSIGF